MLLEKKQQTRSMKNYPGHSALSQKSVAEKMFKLFLDRNICVGTQKNRLDVTDILS